MRRSSRQTRARFALEDMDLDDEVFDESELPQPAAPSKRRKGGGNDDDSADIPMYDEEDDPDVDPTPAACGNTANTKPKRDRDNSGTRKDQRKHKRKKEDKRPASKKAADERLQSIDTDQDHECYVCGKEDGELIPCSTCIRAFRVECLDPSMRPAGPAKDWICPVCTGSPVYRCLRYVGGKAVSASMKAQYTINEPGNTSDVHMTDEAPKDKVESGASNVSWHGCYRCGEQLYGHNQDTVVLCDFCNREWHYKCLRIKQEPMYNDTWFCPICLEQPICCVCHSEVSSKAVVQSHVSPKKLLQCCCCLLKYHPPCVADSNTVPAHLLYHTANIEIRGARKPFGGLGRNGGHAVEDDTHPPTDAHGRVATQLLLDQTEGWLCEACQGHFSVQRVLAQREVRIKDQGRDELQLLCKFKELSYRHVVWLPAVRVQSVSPTAWKKWHAHHAIHHNVAEVDIPLDEQDEVVIDEQEEEDEEGELEVGTNGGGQGQKNGPAAAAAAETTSTGSPTNPDDKKFPRPPGVKADWLRVARVLDRRRCVRGTGRLELLIKWCSLAYDEATWEHAVVAHGSAALALYNEQEELERILSERSKARAMRRCRPDLEVFHLSASQTGGGSRAPPEGVRIKKGTHAIIQTSAPTEDKTPMTGDRSGRGGGPNGGHNGLKDAFIQAGETSDVPHTDEGHGELDDARRREKLVRSFVKGAFTKYYDKPRILAGSFLYDYQLDGLNWLRYSYHSRTSVILADEMGLGKTVQVISFLTTIWSDYGVQGPFLVVAPLSTIEEVWIREFNRWAPFLNVIPYVGSKAAREICRNYELYCRNSTPSGSGVTEWLQTLFREDIKKDFDSDAVRHRVPKESGRRDTLIKFDVLLTSYELLRKDEAVLRAIPWKIIAVDEGHRLKGWRSELKRSLDEFSSEMRVLMTGTPLQNTIGELFSLLHFLDPAKFPESAQNSYSQVGSSDYGDAIERLKSELQPHILRRTKRDVMKGAIPKKKEQIIRVESTAYQKQIYKHILQKSYDALLKDKFVSSLRNVVMQLRKCCNHTGLLMEHEPMRSQEQLKDFLDKSGKMQLLDRMLFMLRSRGHRVLIFSQMTRMLDLLEEYCYIRKWGWERLDGSTPVQERQRAIDRYNSDQSGKFIFLLSTRAGGLGINLTSADTVIIFDSDWNPHNDMQAQARAHRLGQKKKVAIFRFITRASVEERMVEMARNKLVLDQVVAGRIQPKEISSILQCGAKELFEAGSEDKEIRYDDAQLESILDRGEQQLAEDEGTAAKGGPTSLAGAADDQGEGVLDAFKVARYGEVEVEEEVGEDAPLPSPSEGEDDNKTFWRTLLEEGHKKLQAEEAAMEMTLHETRGRGQRVAKRVNYADEDEAGAHGKQGGDKGQGKKGGRKGLTSKQAMHMGFEMQPDDDRLALEQALKQSLNADHKSLASGPLPAFVAQSKLTSSFLKHKGDDAESGLSSVPLPLAPEQDIRPNPDAPNSHPKQHLTPQYHAIAHVQATRDTPQIVYRVCTTYGDMEGVKAPWEVKWDWAWLTRLVIHQWKKSSNMGAQSIELVVEHQQCYFLLKSYGHQASDTGSRAAQPSLSVMLLPLKKEDMQQLTMR